MMRTGILDDELLHEHNFKIEKKNLCLMKYFLQHLQAQFGYFGVKI